MTLSSREEHLVETLRKLPAEATDGLIRWAEQLADLAGGRSLEWSDTWTEEDMEDIQRASFAYFDAQEQKTD